MSGFSSEPIENPPDSHRPGEEFTLLPGWPGYRTQPGRSGYDYIDTQLEIAHMAGIFLRQLVTKSWRRPGFGPHPLVILIVGFGLLFAFPGNRYECPGIIGVLLIALISAVRNWHSDKQNDRKTLPDEKEINQPEHDEDEN